MRLVKKSIIISSIFAINAVVQFSNQIVITRMFGASQGLEVFLAAVAIPTLIVSGIYATLSDAFLPIYGKINNKREEAEKFLQESWVGLVMIGIGLSILLTWGSEKISWWLYRERGRIFVEAVSKEMRILVWGIPIAIGVVIMGSVYYAHKKFMRFPIAQLLGNVGILIGVVSLGRKWGEKILLVMFLVSLLIQGIIMKIKWQGKRINWQKTKQVVEAWIPMIMSFVILRSEGVIVRYFASGLKAGYLVYLNLTSKLMIMAVGIATIGVQILLLPNLVEKLGEKKDKKEGVKLVKEAKIIGGGVAIVVSTMTMIVLPWLLRVLLQGSKFSYQEVRIVQQLLKWFVVPAISLGIYPIFVQPLIALNKQKVVAKIASGAGLGAGLIALMGKLSNVGVMWNLSLTLSSLGLISIIGSEIAWQRIKKQLVA